MGNSPFRTRDPIGEALRRIVQQMRRFRLDIVGLGKIHHGQAFWIARGADLRCPEFCNIGERVSVGKNFTLECNLVVGDDVLISSNVSIVGNDHKFRDPSTTVFLEGRTPASVVEIEGDNLIGFGVIVVGSVKIARGCIVGAGAVVTRDLPPYSICVGVPARAVGDRFRQR